MQRVSTQPQLLKPYFFIGFILVFFIFVKGQVFDYQTIAGKSYSERHLFLFDNFYLNHALRSDSVKYFQEVAQLTQVAENANDKELVLESKFLRFNYLSSKKYPHYLKEIKEFLLEVDKSGITHLQARVRQAIGLHYFYERNNYSEAYLYLIDSYPYIQQLSLEELPDKQELIYNIGFINYSIGYDSKALKFLEEAQGLSNNYYPTLECNIINTQGLIYEQGEDFDKAINSFNELQKIAHEIKNDIWIRVAKNNIANILLKQNKTEEAFQFLNGFPHLDYKESEEIGIVESRRLMLLGKIYVAQKKWNELAQVAPILENLIKTINIPLRIRKDIYSILASDQEAKGNLKQAFLFQDSALILTNEYYQLKNDQGLKQTLEKERVEDLLKEKLKTEHQQKVTLITRVSLLIILVLIVILSIVIFIKQKEKFKKKRLEVELELNQSKTRLTDLLGELKSKDREVQAFEDELEQLYKSIDKDENQIHEKQKTLEMLLSKPIMTDNKWVVFKRSFDKVHPDYIEKLQKNIPNISPAEIRYMYFRKLNLTPKEIAYVLGISQGSIRQYKHRIRAKIDIGSDENIDKFLDSI